MNEEIGFNECSTYEVKIYCGRRVGYTDEIVPMSDVERICDEFVNRVRSCVTITETQFRYVGGSEPGVVVGFINYPRFPQPQDVIRSNAHELAQLLMIGLRQFRISIVSHSSTTMLTNKKLERELEDRR
jgi:hypothetical protein